MAAPMQQKVPIETIQDGIVFLKGGGMRGILMTSSTNFALKSTDEQDALIAKYQGFLNSLDFQVEILMISRQLDLSPYLGAMEQKRREQPNELLRIQINEYMDFVRSLVQVSSIMSQSFYVVIPLSKVEKKETNIIEKLGLLKKATGENHEETRTKEELVAQLWQRMQFVSSGLAGLGIKATPLKTEEVIDLFYRLYNMGTAEAPTSPETKK